MSDSMVEKYVPLSDYQKEMLDVGDKSRWKSYIEYLERKQLSRTRTYDEKIKYYAIRIMNEIGVDNMEFMGIKENYTNLLQWESLLLTIENVHREVMALKSQGINDQDEIINRSLHDYFNTISSDLVLKKYRIYQNNRENYSSCMN